MVGSAVGYVVMCTVAMILGVSCKLSVICGRRMVIGSSSIDRYGL